MEEDRWEEVPGPARHKNDYDKESNDGNDSIRIYEILILGWHIARVHTPFVYKRRHIGRHRRLEMYVPA